jgi:hypothetical protein
MTAVGCGLKAAAVTVRGSLCSGSEESAPHSQHLELYRADRLLSGSAYLRAPFLLADTLDVKLEFHRFRGRA